MAAKCFFGCLYNMWFPSHQPRHLCIVSFFVLRGFFSLGGASNFCFHVVYVFVTLYRSHWMSTIRDRNLGWHRTSSFSIAQLVRFLFVVLRIKVLKNHDIGQVGRVKILMHLDSHKFYINYHQGNSNFRTKTKVHKFVYVIGYFAPTKRTFMRY